MGQTAEIRCKSAVDLRGRINPLCRMFWLYIGSCSVLVMRACRAFGCGIRFQAKRGLLRVHEEMLTVRYFLGFTSMLSAVALLVNQNAYASPHPHQSRPKPASSHAIVIDAATAEPSEDGQSISFFGDVVAKQAKISMSADLMTASYSISAGVRRLNGIDMVGNVQIKDGKRLVRANEAMYKVSEAVLVFRGNVHFAENGRQISKSNFKLKLPTGRYVDAGADAGANISERASHQYHLNVDSN